MLNMQEAGAIFACMRCELEGYKDLAIADRKSERQHDRKVLNTYSQLIQIVTPRIVHTEACYQLIKQVGVTSDIFSMLCSMLCGMLEACQYIVTVHCQIGMRNSMRNLMFFHHAIHSMLKACLKYRHAINSMPKACLIYKHAIIACYTEMAQHDTCYLREQHAKRGMLYKMLNYLACYNWLGIPRTFPWHAMIACKQHAQHAIAC